MLLLNAVARWMFALLGSVVVRQLSKRMSDKCDFITCGNHEIYIKSDACFVISHAWCIYTIYIRPTRRSPEDDISTTAQDHQNIGPASALRALRVENGCRLCIGITFADNMIC